MLTFPGDYNDSVGSFPVEPSTTHGQPFANLASSGVALPLRLGILS